MKADATSMPQAHHSENAVVRRSTANMSCFIRAAGRTVCSLEIPDALDVGFAKLLAELGEDRLQCVLELRLVDVVDHFHSLRAEVSDAIALVVFDAGAVDLHGFLGGGE